MADTAISALPVITVDAGTDLVPVVQGSVTSVTTLAKILTWIQTQSEDFLSMTGFGKSSPAYMIDVLGGGLHVGALANPNAPTSVGQTGATGATQVYYWVSVVDIAGSQTLPSALISLATSNARSEERR